MIFVVFFVAFGNDKEKSRWCDPEFGKRTDDKLFGTFLSQLEEFIAVQVAGRQTKTPKERMIGLGDVPVRTEPEMIQQSISFDFETLDSS